ncbi:MAG: hypothetical protein IPJ88_01835 [Myxococcales bacterium]|nr:MAG: hypothetical protein IPJ88_01835 [Myxococcales bacterium]
MKLLSVLIGTLVWVVACGGSGASSAGQATVSCPVQEQKAASQPEIEALLRDVLAPQLCARVQGSFVALPEEGAPEGPLAASAPAVGRWNIDSCQSQIKDDVLEVFLQGSGFTWVDQQSSGFQVKQYLFFDASASFRAKAHLGYEPTKKVVSLWLIPDGAVQANVQPKGDVSARATNVFSSVVGGVLDFAGSSVDAQAVEQARHTGTERFKRILAKGFTLSIDLGKQQSDFMVGQLALGELPKRPFDNLLEGQWLINGRSKIWPGGWDILGPIPQQPEPRVLQVGLETGHAAELSVLCAELMQDFLRGEQAFSSDMPKLARKLSKIDKVGMLESIKLPDLSCPLVVMITPAAGNAEPVTLRYRDMPEALLHQQGAQLQGASAVHYPVEVSLLDVQLAGKDANGRDWDLLGGRPDIFVVSSYGQEQRQLDRTNTVQDNKRAVFNRKLPRRFTELDLPLRFMIFDADATRDELVGMAMLESKQLPKTNTTTKQFTLSLAVRSLNADAKVLGYLRLKVIHP